MRINSRASWGARRPRARTIQDPRDVRELFLHYPASGHALEHLDTDSEQDAYMRAIQAFHMDGRGWSDFAYSFAVFQDGEVYRGRGVHAVPAAQAGHNTNTFAVLCVLGNTEVPSSRMRESLVALKNYLDRRAGRDLLARPHSAVVSTSCPGPHLRAFIPALNRLA